MRRTLPFIIHVVYFLAHCAIGIRALSVTGGERAAALNRRDFFSTATSTAATVTVTAAGLASAADAAVDGGTIRPIGIVGANGRTGALCVASCLRRGIPVRALTRSGSWSSPSGEEYNMDNMVDDKLLSIQQCDARDISALETGISGCSAVIYAASASKKGGKAKEIDNEAVIAAGKACIAKCVGRYVVISSTAATRPKSLGYLFTNVFQNIMGEKRLGELGVMSAYDNINQSSSLLSSSYTIIRPGGLEEAKLNVVLGPAALELSQGDAIAGIISRADLAEVAVQTAQSQSTNLQNTAFELYYTDSAQPCEGRFKYLLQNGQVARLHGDTYDALIHGLKPDGTYFVPN